MNLPDIANKNKILEMKTGSHLYGTSRPESDEDFVGIFIANENCYLGLTTVEEVDLSIVSKLKNGKNDSNAIDRKLYELKKFVKLAMDNNPNILEMLFPSESSKAFVNEYGNLLLENAHLFPWKNVKQKFLGYAYSQRHKMQIKVENLDVLKASFDFFSKEKEKGNAVRLIAEYRDNKELLSAGVKFYEHNFSVGDQSFNPKIFVKDILDRIQKRLDKAGHRTEIIEKYQYDTKFGMHLIRLMYEGLALLQTGKLVFPLPQASLLLDIRYGKYAMEEVIKLSEILEAQVVEAEKHSPLPIKPRYEEIEKLLIHIVKKFHSEER